MYINVCDWKHFLSVFLCNHNQGLTPERCFLYLPQSDLFVTQSQVSCLVGFFILFIFLQPLSSGLCAVCSRWVTQDLKLATTLRQKLKWNHFAPSLFICPSLCFCPYSTHTDTPNTDTTRGHFHMRRKLSESSQLGPNFTSNESQRRSERQYEWTRCFLSVEKGGGWLDGLI